MCRASFAPGKKLLRRATPAGRAVGIVFCSRPCALRFEREIGGDPFLHDFAIMVSPPERRCKRCNTPIGKSAYSRCRLCRLTITISESFRTAAARNARFARTLAAQRVYERPPEREETWEVIS
jgi:hypothetical protein